MSHNSQANVPSNPQPQGSNEVGPVAEEEVVAETEAASAGSASRSRSQAQAQSQFSLGSMRQRMMRWRREPQPYTIPPFADDPYLQPNRAENSATYHFLNRAHIAEQETRRNEMEAIRNVMAGEGTSRAVMGIPSDHIRGMDTTLVQHGEMLAQQDQRIQQALKYVEILWENADRERDQRERMQCLVITLGVIVLFLAMLLAHVLVS
jgi:hypothetical protein